MSKKTKSTKKVVKKSTKKSTSVASKTTKKVSKKPVMVSQKTSVASAQPKTPVLANKKKQAIMVVIAIILAILYIFRGQFVVALVNGQPIFRATLVKDLENQAGKPTLDAIITKTLVFQEAKRQKVNVSDQDIQDEIAKLEGTFAAEGQSFDDLLKLQGVTRAEVEEQIELQKLVEKMATENLTVTDEEVTQYMEINADFLPESTDEAALKASVKDQLQQQKTNDGIQTWLAKIQADAKINHWLFEEEITPVLGGAGAPQQ